MNNTQRFDGKGIIYAKARPGYSAKLFEYLEDTLHISRGCSFADIGSGTGIFSESLLKRGYRVYAVEPNTDMRKQAEEMLKDEPNFISVNGTACSTTLPVQSVDYITAAQAFHWFDPFTFKKECRRILKPNGRVIIVYNTRDESAECNKALADLHRKYCPEFQGFSKGMNEEKCRAFFDNKCDMFRTDNSKVYDRQGYINRALSSSYSLCEKDEGYEKYIEEMNKLFDTFAVDGKITVPMFTVGYMGTV